MSNYTLSPGHDDIVGQQFGDNIYQFNPQDLQATDVVTGGADLDSMFVVSPGTISASQFAGVTNIEQLVAYSPGNHTFTLTDGLVSGASGGYFSVVDYLPDVSGSAINVVDASAITGTPIVLYAGFGTDNFKGGQGNDVVVINPANLTSADVIQGGAGFDILNFNSATGNGNVVAASAFANVTGIEGIVLGPFGDDVTLTNALVAGSDTGSFTVTDSVSDDTVDASGVTNHAVLVFSSQGGSDTFLGGNGANGYLFAADDLTAADTVHGGTGVDNLIFKTAGTLDASAFTHVSGIETLILADGTNHVTLTDGLVSGTSIGYFAAYGGTGDDTIDASAVTSATPIAFLGTGGGDDTFVGGNGADSFLFAAGQLTAGDTVAGGSGADTLWITTAGTTNSADLAGVSGIEGVYLQSGGTFHFANGITTATGIAAAGTAAADTFDASAVTDYRVVFSGNGGADTLRGGSQDDVFLVPDSGFASIDGGGGSYNRIVLTSPSQVFDLTANVAKITNIEIIDLTKTAASLNLAGTDIAQINPTGHSLYIVGDANDSISAPGDFTLVAAGITNNAVAPGHTFYEYQHSSGSFVFVDSAILIAVPVDHLMV